MIAFIVYFLIYNNIFNKTNYCDGGRYLMDEKIKAAKSHKIMIDNRRKAEITGVNDVISFDLNTILLETDYGMVTIKGSNLHVNRLSVEKGEVDVEGKLDGINYSDVSSYAKKGESFISRMLK